MKVDLSTYNNKEYHSGNVLKKLIWYYVNLIVFQSGLFPIYIIKTFLLKLFGARIGKGVVIKPHVNIKYPWLLEIGNHVWIGEQVWIDNLAKVTIGDNVCISQGALLLCGNHDYKKTSFDLMVKPILIEEGAWVGAKSTVCGGVIVQSHAVLSVGSVATSSLGAFGIYSGNPAVKIRDRVLSV